MLEFILYTLKTMKVVNGKRYFIKLTQNLDRQYNRGHFNWVIEDSVRNILSTGSSTAGVRKKQTLRDLDEIFVRWFREYAS